MKRVTVLLLVLTMIVSLSACQKDINEAISAESETESAESNYGVNVMKFSISQPSNVKKFVDGEQFGFSTSSPDNTDAFLRASAHLKKIRARNYL